MMCRKAFARIWRGSSSIRGRSSAPAGADGPAIRCSHCGGSRLKLSYRRLEGPTQGDDPNSTRTTFILRCADCEGFTTVSA